ncbi:hypothetical protein DPMN_092285 [Dreissena polymorpha]|uniref:Uncharacterized protein n=1 Tax=Dreissena polymorpha TaxID=45954 RepID=A0A9D4L3N1_DREPO|nr:hypothetical protein DPMN_092285 [Dreissena polymorpha]
MRFPPDRRSFNGRSWRPSTLLGYVGSGRSECPPLSGHKGIARLKFAQPLFKKLFR